MSASAMESAAVTALLSVLHRIHQATERSGRSPDRVRVVAVSKTKPVDVIRRVYDAGHRCFGENYVQEIVDKAPQLPADIEWHFIGHLQSNKVKPLLGYAAKNKGYRVFNKRTMIIEESMNVTFDELNQQTIDDDDDEDISTPSKASTEPETETSYLESLPKRMKFMADHPKDLVIAAVPNLEMVETVDDKKIADRLDRVVANLGRKPLKVLVQVNTSGEESKFGVDPSGCVELAKHVKQGCTNLVFSGLMTIGMLDYSSTPENFKTLSNCRTDVCEALGIPEEQCELSMGMSNDFEQAIELGSTSVRIGSIIFGPREYPKKDNAQ
ncbi:putative proline synthase co-transcribed bacterial-like protein [Iris pallida]|uniref:Pyridoxal phosphate homeostasis protein n=1 Tax=Iris pallida TaxID=29817 RepID=A0AAX6FWF2_IRIPA|nr:putative proline synthase co-transcribed bacterial-like protein [Iris pallida]